MGDIGGGWHGAGCADVRARRGRRTVEERQQAVLDLMAGKATVEQIAHPLGKLVPRSYAPRPRTRGVAIGVREERARECGELHCAAHRHAH